MLEFSRQSQPTMEAVDMAEIVSQSLEMVRYMLGVKGIEVKVDVQPGLPPIAGSRVALQQVLVNLFNNAWQAMQSGGTLSVRAWFDKGSRALKVAVADTGSGIAESDLGRIFDPFFTTKSVGEGTGLGLSISYGIIKDHQGELSVESRVGHGTTFTIVLPVRESVATVN
jgi:two-component system, NtrC family, sensor kinase